MEIIYVIFWAIIWIAFAVLHWTLLLGTLLAKLSIHLFLWPIIIPAIGLLAFRSNGRVAALAGAFVLTAICAGAAAGFAWNEIVHCKADMDAALAKPVSGFYRYAFAVAPSGHPVNVTPKILWSDLHAQMRGQTKVPYFTASQWQPSATPSCPHRIILDGLKATNAGSQGKASHEICLNDSQFKHLQELEIQVQYGHDEATNTNKRIARIVADHSGRAIAPASELVILARFSSWFGFPLDIVFPRTCTPRDIELDPFRTYGVRSSLNGLLNENLALATGVRYVLDHP